ncbi:MAG: M56 family metallopeptidase [Tissierellia bacterium]|nr:M56 family metallopeptidase [Tissierellia bacterium]
MDKLFLTVLNMSLTASYVIAFVIAIRLFLKKFPKNFSYLLWIAVLFRLICPFSFDSIVSLIPKNINIPQDIAYMPKPEINSGITVIDSAVNNVLPSPPINQIASANPMQIWLAIGEAVWLIGITILLIYSVITTVKLYSKLRNAKHIKDNIYLVNGFKTPFVFGIVYPKVYLPDRLLESEKSYVSLHEQTHIKRLDHIVKLIFFIATCIHWFNPLAWIAFYLMGEDMELSCDEKVVKQMGSSIKKEYSSSLLSMSTGRRILGGSPIAFGENNTKDRIKNVLNYKKPKFWVIVILIFVIIAVGIGLMTNPKNDKSVTVSNEDKISAYLKENSINTFSLYYELLDFNISDYQEKVVDGKIEAIFSYTIVHKNYDRDPDTVQYIKEAKERGDKNYQTYYNEYLQSQNMNFFLKAVIDEYNTITLYSKNPAIESEEWHQVEMSDFVIGKITEEHESENINRNEPIENNIAEYISYDYENRSIYIAGLKIFEEFGTEEFEYANEGSARIINDENAIEFFITVSTGLVPGAGSITGPDVYFKMALDTNEIVEKKLTHAPNYAEIAKLNPEHINPDSIQYSEKIIELSDERIIEIGEYLKEFILEVESKLDYFTYED